MLATFHLAPKVPFELSAAVPPPGVPDTTGNPVQKVVTPESYDSNGELNAVKGDGL